MLQVAEQNPDPVWGAAAIGRVIGRNQRLTFSLLERGLLPARKVGGRWVASKRKLLATVTGDEPTGPAP
jgi:hypothetical protein